MADATLKSVLLGEDRSASKALKGVGDEANKTRGHFGGLAKAAAGVFAAGAIIAGAKAVGGALIGMAKNAAEDAAGQRRLAIALHNSTGATRKQIAANEDWIGSQGVALGVTDDELRPALQRLAQSTGSISKAQKLAGLAMDASAGSGKSLKVVSEALAKAQAGNMGALSKLGIRIKDTEGKTMSFSAVTKEMAKTFHGQAAAAADTVDGKFARLKLQFDETKEAIGARLLPIAGKLADWLLSDFGPAVKLAGDWFKEKILPPMKDFGEKIAPQVHALMGKVKQAFSDARPYFDLLGKVLANVVLPVMKKAAELVLPALGLAIQAVGKAFGAIGKVFTWTWNNVLQPVLRFLVSAIATVTDGFAAMLRALSKVPGFGWAKDAAESLQRVADKLHTVSNGIDKIDGKRATITVDIKANVAKNVNAAGAAATAGIQNMFGGAGRVAPRMVDTNSITSAASVAGASFRAASARGGYGAAGGDFYSFEINGALDPIAVGKQIQALLLQLKRLSGGAALGLG